MLKASGIAAAAANLGIPAAAVRLLSGAFGRDDRPFADEIMQTFLASRIVLAVLLVAAGFVASPIVATGVLGHRELDVILLMSCVAAASNAILAVPLGHLQARRWFRTYAGLNAATSALKVVVVGALIGLGVKAVLPL